MLRLLMLYGLVFDYNYRRTGSLEKAEDDTQETFTRLLEQNHEHIENLAGWVFGIAKRIAKEGWREEEKKKRTSSLDAEHIEPQATDASNTDVIADVRNALEGLESLDREIAKRRADGETWNEIATFLGLSRSTIFDRWTRHIVPILKIKLAAYTSSMVVTIEIESCIFCGYKGRQWLQRRRAGVLARLCPHCGTNLDD